MFHQDFKLYNKKSTYSSLKKIIFFFAFKFLGLNSKLKQNASQTLERRKMLLARDTRKNIALKFMQKLKLVR